MLQRYGGDARLKVLALVVSVGLIVVVLHGVGIPHVAQSSSPRNASAHGSTSSTTTTSTQRRTVQGMVIAFSSAPGQFGTYTLTVTVRGAQQTSAKPVQGAKVTSDLTMLSMRMEPVQVTLAPVPPSAAGTMGVYHAQNVIAMAGLWQAIVTVVPPGDAQQVQATFQFTERF